MSTIQEYRSSVRLLGEYGIDDVCLSIPVTVGIGGAGGRVPIPPEGRGAAGPGDLSRDSKTVPAPAPTVREVIGEYRVATHR